jgi:hypothetical protein
MDGYSEYNVLQQKFQKGEFEKMNMHRLLAFRS